MSWDAIMQFDQDTKRRELKREDYDEQPNFFITKKMCQRKIFDERIFVEIFVFEKF
jgi:hypothetical protein